ncbi:MAG: hypothetical protein PHT43_07910, partial [Anaerolineaceae bacterium]|nr:hypothetical protein [Anaerolineaceae bacterium]
MRDPIYSLPAMPIRILLLLPFLLPLIGQAELKMTESKRDLNPNLRVRIFHLNNGSPIDYRLNYLLHSNPLTGEITAGQAHNGSTGL